MRAVLVTLVLLGGLVGAGALGLRLYLGRAAEMQLRADEIIDFQHRDGAGRSNVYAICPPAYCLPPADAESPVFALPWERLRERWLAAIAAEPRQLLVAEAAGGRRLAYIQRSRLLLFPDIVTVEFVPLGAARSSLAIDSRSRYGKGDFGVNRRRVERWIGLLRGAAAP
jgi:uncharacterized protein (DUF1499 family)